MGCEQVKTNVSETLEKLWTFMIETILYFNWYFNCLFLNIFFFINNTVIMWIPLSGDTKSENNFKKNKLVFSKPTLNVIFLQNHD